MRDGAQPVSISPGSQSPTNSEPLVTIIVATYNRSQILAHTLRSLQLQRFTEWEAWIVGDGCTDDSEATVASFGDERMHWTNLRVNSGSQAAPNNEGLRRARGRYIAYVGHDDLWLPWHLEGLIGCIEEQEADLVHALIAAIGPRGAELARGAVWPGESYETTFIPPSGWLHRRDVIDSCGWWGNPDRIAVGVDREFLRRVYRTGKRIVAHPRLSVLKFISSTWSMYSLQGEYPQTRYLKAIETDAQGVHDQVLLELALHYAAYSTRLISVDEGLQLSWRRLGHRILDRYIEHPPLSWMLIWRYQRIRRRMRRTRGLPSRKR
jgi:glycosyltransferase involved in cell wall biosynthesis